MQPQASKVVFAVLRLQVCLVLTRFQDAQAVDVPGALAVNGISVQTPQP